jgi:hypothetical protein
VRCSSPEEFAVDILRIRPLRFFLHILVGFATLLSLFVVKPLRRSFNKLAKFAESGFVAPAPRRLF